MTKRKPASEKPLNHLRASDLRGVAQLATQATQGVTRIVEGVHQSVYDTMGVPGGPATGQTRGVTGLVYKSIHGVTQAGGQGAGPGAHRADAAARSRRRRASPAARSAKPCWRS